MKKKFLYGLIIGMLLIYPYIPTKARTYGEGCAYVGRLDSDADRYVEWMVLPDKYIQYGSKIQNLYWWVNKWHEDPLDVWYIDMMVCYSEEVVRIDSRSQGDFNVTLDETLAKRLTELAKKQLGSVANKRWPEMELLFYQVIKATWEKYGLEPPAFPTPTPTAPATSTVTLTATQTATQTATPTATATGTQTATSTVTTTAGDFGETPIPKSPNYPPPGDHTQLLQQFGLPVGFLLVAVLLFFVIRNKVKR